MTMPVLTILPASNTIQVAEGISILQALLNAEEKVPQKCDEAKCGSCHIFIHDGRKTVSRMQRLENERLDSIVGIGSKSRLACQTQIGAGDVTIELLGFGSGL
jgi:2Fe-2S ferredoxin